MAIFHFKPQKETGNNSTVSEIEQPEVIESVVTVPPEITHEEMVGNAVDGTATNEINEINVKSGQSRIAETTEPPQQVPEQSNNAHESAISENDIENGPDQLLPEFNSVDSIETLTEIPPASISQRKNRRKHKKPHLQEDNSIDEEFASRLDMSCADAETAAPQIEDAHVASYIR